MMESILFAFMFRNKWPPTIPLCPDQSESCYVNGFTSWIFAFRLSYYVTWIRKLKMITSKIGLNSLHYHYSGNTVFIRADEMSGEMKLISSGIFTQLKKKSQLGIELRFNGERLRMRAIGESTRTNLSRPAGHSLLCNLEKLIPD